MDALATPGFSLDTCKRRSSFFITKGDPLVAQSPSLWNSRGVSNFLRSCRFFGLFLDTTDGPNTHTNCYIALSRNVWQKILILMAVLIASMDTWMSVSRHKDRLTSLEFTAMSIAFHRIFKVTMVVIIAAGAGRFCRKAQVLMQEINDLNHEFWQSKASRIVVRQRLSRLASICWGVACGCLSAGVVGAYATFERIGARSAAERNVSFTWSLPQDFPVVQSLPMWAVFVAYSSSYSLIVGIVVFPQLVVILFVYPLGIWFDFLAISLEVSTFFK